MLHYSDNFKISNYKIKMDTPKKIKELKLKINEIKEHLEDFIDLNQAKQNKITNLENEINDMKKGISGYLDELENLINQK